MISKRIAVGVLLLIGLCVLAAPGAARTIENGDTVFDCETNLDLSAIAENGDKLVNYDDNFSIPIADVTSLNLTVFDLQGHYHLYNLIPSDPMQKATNFIYIEKPSLSLDVCHNADLSSSLDGAKVKNIIPIAFKISSLQVGTYLPTAMVRVEITKPDGEIITGIPDADGVVRNLTNHTLDGYMTYIMNVDISGLEAGTYTARAVWESPQDFADYAEDSNTVNFTVTISGISIGTYMENPMKTNPFTVTISGSPDSDYYLYVENAGLAAYRYPFIMQNQSSVDVLNAASFPDSADPDAKALAESERAVADGAYVPGTAAVVTTGAEGFCSIEFCTNDTTVPMTYFITVVDPADISRIDQAKVTIKEGGKVEIIAEGAGSYYLGDEIKLSGINTNSHYVYLFMILSDRGDGTALDNVSACASDGNYVRCPVETDGTWAYSWDTTALGKTGHIVDSSFCTLYACGNNIDSLNNNVDKKHLSGVKYSTLSISLQTPTLDLDKIESVVVNGYPLTIRGTATGDPGQVKLWIFGENYRLFGVNVPVEDDGSFAYTLGGHETSNFYLDPCYIIVQHPMYEHSFDVFPFTPGNTTDFRVADRWSSDIIDLGSLAPEEAATTLIDMIDSPNDDDICCNATFTVEEPRITIDPIANHTVGDTFTITGTTNLAVGDQLNVNVQSASFTATPKTESSGFTGCSGTVTVTEGTGGLNKWSFDLNTTGLKADQYRIKVEGLNADVDPSTTVGQSTTFFLTNKTPGGAYAAITLSPGWNFVSTPRVLADGENTIGIFNGVDTADHSVLYYDGAEGWGAMSSADTFEPLDGIWIYANGTYEIPLTFATGSDPVTPPTKNLDKGWNAIGFSDIEPASTRDTLLSLGDAWSVLMGFDATTQAYETSIIRGGSGKHSDTGSMMPMKGYWMYMNDAGTLAAIGS